MSKQNILNTPFAQSYNLELMAKEAARFLQKNMPNMDMTQDGYVGLLSDVNPMTVSHMNSLYRNLVDADKLSSVLMFSLVKDKKADLPELLTIDDIVVDGKYLQVPVSKELQKTWVNLTPALTITKRDRYGSIYVDDIPKVVSSMVRAFLCTSYNDSTEWLPPKISTFIIEFYTMAMSMVMDRLFNLSWEESFIPKMMFAWHYSALLGPEKDTDDFPVLLSRNAKVFKGAVTGAVLKETIDKVNEIRDGRTMSLEIVAEVLRKMGPRRMENLQASDIRRLFSLSAQDNTAMMIAIDYPPYLVHQILRVAEGGKHAIMSTVFKNRFSGSYVKGVLDQLVITKQLIDGVKR